MGCDYNELAANVERAKFQSTHPVWDATAVGVARERLKF